MKVESEGMVAIVQGLRDAGLTVTLLGHRNNNMVTATAVPGGQDVHVKSSQEARASPPSTIDTAAQLCDDRYTSSYQVAHCNVQPTSPVPNPPEFPRRRNDLIPTQGNFEIGDKRSVNTRSPIKISVHQTNTYSSPDRGLLSNTQSSKGTDAFVTSLRKYPSISPDKHLSSELVQRVLAYTQAKNFFKSSHHSKAIRNIRNKIFKEQTLDGVRSGNLSKGVQTYTRMQARRRERDIDMGGMRDAKLRRYKNIQISETYDYLTPRQFRSKVVDVRYLSDVTRCLRDTLRQICDDQTQVCPNIQSRYSRHRREHHHDYMDPQSSMESNNMEAQVSVPMVSRGVSCLPTCEAIPGTYIPICPTRPKLCCYCQKPLPCNCQEPSQEEIFQRKLEEIVYTWFQELPICSNDKPQNKDLRENMIIDLIEKLKSLDHDEYFEEKAKNEISDCVNSLPIWCPGAGQDVFKMQIIDNLMTRIRGLSSDAGKYMEEIAKWVDNISFKHRNSQGEVVNEIVAKEKMVEKLGAFIISPPPDDTLKSEVAKVLNEFPIKIEGDKTIYIDNLAQTLADKLQTMPLKDSRRESTALRDEFEKQIWDWLQDIPKFSRSSNLKENRKQVEALTKNLQKLQARGIDSKEVQEEMQNEINEWLERNADSLDIERKNKLSEKLLKNLVKASKAVSRGAASSAPGANKNLITEQILDWLEEIPELSESKSKNENLATSLQELIKDCKDESEIESKTLNWLTNKLNEKGKQMDTKDQKILVKKLLGKMSAVPIIKDEEVLTNDILNVLEDLSDLDVTSDQSKKLASELAKKMRELQINGQNVNEETTKDEIMEWLSKLTKTTGVKLTTRDREKLTNKLLFVMKAPKQRKRWSKQADLKTAINDQISQIFEEDAKHLDEDTKKELQNIISDLISKNIDKVLSDDSNEVMTDIVDILEEKAGLATRKANQIANRIINEAKTLVPSNRRSVSKEMDLKKLFKQEINSVLENTEVENKDEIELEISNILASQGMRGENDEQTKERLINVLKNSNLSQDESENIVNQLMGTRRRLPTNYDFQSNVRKNSKSLSPMQKEIFITNAEREILEFTENLLEDSGICSTKKTKVAVVKLAERVGDIMSDSNTMHSDKIELLNDEVLQYLQDIEIHPSPKQKEQTKKLVDKLQNLAFATSTPRSSNADNDRYFRPRRDSLDPTMSRIDEYSTNSQYNNQQTPTKEEKQYTSQLENKIANWLKTLPIHFEIKDNKGFKETMIKDLAGDIVDRQKYLQLNPSAKTSEEEELEHLKYQVFRWLNKLPDVKQLIPSIAKTHELMKLMKEVPVPQLIKDKRSYNKGTTRESLSQQTSNFSSIHDEISNWMQAIPFHLFTSKDKNHHKKMVKQLTENIDEYQKNNTLTETALDKLIVEWLQKMLTENNQSLKNKSEALKELLISKGVVSFLNDVGSGKGPSLNDLPDNTVDEWIKSLPLRSRKTSMEMRQMESTNQDFIENLKKIRQQYSPETAIYETKVKEEVEKYLQLCPMEQSKRNDQAFIQQKVEELLRKLKHSGTESYSKRPSISNTALKNIIDSWTSNLPFQPGKSASDIKRDVDEFVSRVQEMFRNKNIADINDDLQDQVKAFLSKLPLQKNLVTDEYTQDLTNKLLCLMQSTTKPSPIKAADIFYNDIENWCDGLPIFTGDTPAEKEKVKSLKQNIISKLLNKIGDLNMKPEIFYDDLLYEDLLKDEIDDLLGTLPQTPELINNLESLKENLIEKIRQAKKKSQNELAGHAYKQQLRDAISTTLPSVENVATEEQVSFEILKDTVADAYINLHYTPDNDIKEKYKQKIGDEINRFCNDYLKRFPASPVDPKKLNQDLYTALQKVPKPKDDTIKAQVEQVRIKDQIHEWLKDIPLDDQSPAQQLQKNKIVSILANSLHETEKDKDVHPDIDVYDRMRQDIVKWSKKLPLKPEGKVNIDKEVDKLVERLKSTEDNRRFSISNLKQTSTENKLSQYQSQIPPSTLSKEDRAHLGRIRQRAQRSPCRIVPPICLCKDTSVSPIPVDASSQTEIRLQQYQPISPNINVNEYNWDSTDDSKVWDAQNKSDIQTRMPYPSMLGRSYSRMSQQHMSPQQQNMSWSPPFGQRNSDAMPQNQNESLQPQPCASLPPPCIIKQPPCVTKPTPCLPKQHSCVPQSSLPCVAPTIPCAEPQPPCTTTPLCISSQPPCTPKPQSPPRPPCAAPLPCERQPPCLQQQSSPPLQSHRATQPHCTYLPPCATPPCIPQLPSLTPTPSTPRMEYFPPQVSQLSQQDAPYGMPQRRTSKKPQFCIKSSDISSTSSPVEEYSPSRSLRCQPRTTRLGSLENLPPCMRTCASQSPGTRRSRGSPDDGCEMIREDDDDHDMPCVNRPFRVPLQSVEFIKDRTNDKCKCHCRERCLGKCMGRKPRSCNITPRLTSDSMKWCSKCCGVHCPHPSFLFFR